MLGMVRRIMRFCGPYANRIRLAWVFSFLRAFCANAPFMVAVVLIWAIIADELTVMGCIAAAAAMAVLLVLESLFQHAADRLQSTVGYELFADARMQLANHLRHLPMGYFSEGNLGKISSVLSADMVFIEEHSMTVLADVAANVFAQLIITAFMFVIHPLVGCVTLATVLLAVLVAQPMNREAFDNSQGRQQSIEDLTGALLEYLGGLRIIKSFNLTGGEARDLRDAFRENARTNVKFEEEHSPWQRRLEIVYGAGMTAVVALSVWLLQVGALDAAMFIGVMLFAFNLFKPLQALYAMESQMSIMQAGLERLQGILDEPGMPEVGKPVESVDQERSANEDVPEIEFRDVRFSYGEDEVLHGVSFTAKRGQTVALVGQSGSGKSTIANLLSRFWDVDGGAVLLRGEDIRQMSLSSLMDNLSMVFQRVYLFEDTVFANIAMGKPDATEEQVHEAARKARCYNFIMQMPYGFNTRIGEGGATLSGGEAQRVSIARCILKDSPIVILDEATANIDADNEAPSRPP